MEDVSVGELEVDGDCDTIDLRESENNDIDRTNLI